MPTVDLSSPMWLIAGAYGAALTSALLPWVNAELLLLSALPLTSTTATACWLVLTFTLGQMTGKSVMYWLSRKTRIPVPRVRAAIDRWRGRFEDHPRSALTCVFVSAAVGVPPFYAVSMAAGAFRMAFGLFLAVGSLGRLLHFTVLALVPYFAWRHI